MSIRKPDMPHAWVLLQIDARSRDQAITLHTTLEGAKAAAECDNNGNLEWVQRGKLTAATSYEPSLVHLSIWEAKIGP